MVVCIRGVLSHYEMGIDTEQIARTRNISGVAFYFVLIASFFLSACKVQLYSSVEEQEGNEMIALLMSNNISWEKKPEKDGMVGVYVEESKMAEAVDLLKRSGYPKREFSTIKDIFKQEGLIATPFEERARYIYALSQEIAETLSQIDGVMNARVHVVLPEASRKRSQQRKPSSAAVFIKYNPNYEYLLKNSVPQIKTMVQNGIEGLKYEHISVSMFAAKDEGTLILCPELRSIFSIDVTSDTADRLYTIIIGYVVILITVLGLGGYFFFHYRRLTSVAPGANEETSVTAVSKTNEKTAS